MYIIFLEICQLKLCVLKFIQFVPPSSSGLGHSVLSAETGVQIPLAAPFVLDCRTKGKLRMIKSVCFIFLAFFLSSTSASAQNLPKVEQWEVDESLVRLSPIRFLPDHPLYFLITSKEKFDHFRKPDKADKALFDAFLSGKKIKEAYLLVQKNKLAQALQSLKNYQKINKRLVEELTQATNQGLPVFEAKALLADNLERHLKIIIVLANSSSNPEFKQELAKSVEAAKNSAKLLESHLPDAERRILDLTERIKII